jgi:hypothetical protein
MGKHTRLPSGAPQHNRLTRHCDIPQTGRQAGCFGTTSDWLRFRDVTNWS